jgi:hypothetical protein
MFPVDSLRYSAQIDEARTLLSNGSPVTDVARSVNLPKNVIARLKEDVLNQRILDAAQLTRVSRHFQFDDSYRNLIFKYFSTISRDVCEQLAHPRCPGDFILSLRSALIAPRNLFHPFPPLLPVTAFLRELLALEGGDSLVYSVTTMDRQAVFAVDLPIIVNRMHWMTTTDFLHFISPPVSSRLSIESMIIVDFAPVSGVKNPPLKGRQECNYNQLRVFQAKHARLARRIKSDSIRFKIASLRDQQLERSLRALRKEDRSSFQSVPSLRRIFVNSLLERIDTSLHGQRVDELLLQVSMVVRAYSYTGYEFLRRYLPLPDLSTLHRHYASRIQAQEINLSEIEKIPSIIEGRVPFTYATIAVDAISLDRVFFSDREPTTASQPNHAFVYECLPLGIEEQCFPVHVMPSVSGNASEIQIRAAGEIVRLFKNLPNPVKVLFIATDGDKGYSSVYECQFAKWFPYYQTHGLTECLKIITGLEPLFVADFLHLLKNVRSRILAYVPIILYGRMQIPVEWQAMEQTIHLGAVFTDRSSAGKMRDSYPVALFRLPNVLKLFSAGRYAEAVYLLPWTLAMIAFRSDAIARSTRLFLLELALAMFTKFYHEIVENPRCLKEQGRAGDRVWPFKRITLLRVMGTIVAVIHALVILDCDVPLDRISTHPLENFFGLLRRLLHDCNRFDEFLHATARNAIVNEIHHELHHKRDICGRENEGGTVSRTEKGISVTPTFTAEHAVRHIWMALSLSSANKMELTTKEMQEIETVMSWLESLERISTTKRLERDAHFAIRATANSKILASLLQDRIN